MARGMSKLPRRSRLWAKRMSRMSRMWFCFAYEILLRSVALSSFDPPGIRVALKCFTGCTQVYGCWVLSLQAVIGHTFMCWSLELKICLNE